MTNKFKEYKKQLSINLIIDLNKSYREAIQDSFDKAAEIHMEFAKWLLNTRDPLYKNFRRQYFIDNPKAKEIPAEAYFNFWFEKIYK